MSTYKNLMTVCCAAVLALGLAACGSSSDDDDQTGMMQPATCPDGQVGTPPNCTTPPPPGPTPEEIAATTKAAKTKLDAIVAEAALTTDSGLGGTGAAASGEGSYSVSVERDRDATTVTVTRNGATMATNKKFMATDLGDGLSMHTLDGEMGVQEIAMVMTDIKAPRAVEFAKWDNNNDATDALPQALDVRADGVTVDTANPADSRDVSGAALVSTTEADAAVLKLIMVGAFAAPGDGSSSVTHTFQPAADDADTTTPGAQPRAAAMVGGTYNGAMGTYTCATGNGGANCSATVNAKGELTGLSDGWIFTPADGATSDQPDYDFLRYGFWLKKTTKDGVTEYNEIALFHGHVGMTDSSGTITGSASYEGSAVGVYVHNVNSEGGGSVESRTAGHFTADATLKAYFTQPTSPNDNIPPNKLNTITGTINNFDLSGGEAQDWSVALTGDVNATFGIDNGTANGGGTAGALSGQFYGAANELPGAATGEFNANFSNGSVAGAFGVNKK